MGAGRPHYTYNVHCEPTALVMASCTSPNAPPDAKPQNGQSLTSTSKSIGRLAQCYQVRAANVGAGAFPGCHRGPSLALSVSGHQFRSVSCCPVPTNHEFRRSLGPPPQCQCLMPTATFAAQQRLSCLYQVSIPATPLLTQSGCRVTVTGRWIPPLTMSDMFCPTSPVLTSHPSPFLCSRLDNRMLSKSPQPSDQNVPRWQTNGCYCYVYPYPRLSVQP